MSNDKKIIHAVAPGKILWLGSYAVLERPNVGFVTAVNAYTHAKVFDTNSGVMKLDAPQFGVKIEGRVDPTTGALEMQVPKELVLLKTAVEIASKYAAGLGIRPQGGTIVTTGDSGFEYAINVHKGLGGRAQGSHGDIHVSKSGLGGSAAVTVASIAGMLQLFGIDPDKKDALHKLAQAAHSLANGKIGSGFDIAASTYGSIAYVRYSPEMISSMPSDYTSDDVVKLVNKRWDYSITKAELPSMFGSSMAHFLEEGVSTTSFVSKVNEFKKKNPEEHKRLIEEINAHNLKALEALSNINAGTDVEHNLSVFKSSAEAGRIKTKLLGKASETDIEPESCTKLIEESERNGAFIAKLPGAGGKEAIAALCTNGMCAELEKFWRTRADLRVLDVKMVNQGYSVSVENQ